jgi:hypothetical protein
MLYLARICCRRLKIYQNIWGFIMFKYFLFFFLLLSYSYAMGQHIKVADFCVLDEGPQRTWALQNIAIGMADAIPNIFNSQRDAVLKEAALHDYEVKREYERAYEPISKGFRALRADTKVLMLERLLRARLGADKKDITNDQIKSFFVTMALKREQEFKKVFNDAKLIDLAKGAQWDNKEYLTEYLQVARLCMEIFEGAEEYVKWLKFYGNQGRFVDYLNPLAWLGIASTDFLKYLCTTSMELHGDTVYKKDMPMTQESMQKLHAHIARAFHNVPAFDSEKLAVLWDGKYLL